MKKKLFVLVTVLLMIVSTAALAAEIKMDGNEYVRQIVAFGDEALLLVTGENTNALRIFKDGEMTEVLSQEEMGYFSNYAALTPEEKAKVDAQVTTLIPGDDGLYAYGAYGKVLYKWDGTQLAPVGKPLQGDIFFIEDGGDTYPRSMQGAMVNGKLLAFFGGDESTHYASVVYTFDPATGESRKLDIKGLEYVEELAIYKNGQVLVCYQDPSNNYQPIIRAVDANAGTISKSAVVSLESYEVGGLVYDAQTDSIYCFDNGKLIRFKTGARPEIVAYPSTNHIYSGAICKGEYLMSDREALRTVPMDGSAMPEQTLTIQGGYVDDVHRAFLAENPNIGINMVDEWYASSEAIATAVKTGEKGVDIFNVAASSGLYALINKGYALDLSESAFITEKTEAFYPGFANALKDKNGNVCGVFYGVDVYGYPRVNVELWAELELGEYPTTYGELIDLIALWETDYADDHPDKTLINVAEKRDLVSMVMEAYILQYEDAPGGLSFNNPVLREVLEKIEALEMRNFDWENMSDADYDEISEIYARQELISLNGGGAMDEGETYSVYHEDGQDAEYTTHLLVPLRFEEDVEPRVVADAEVYIVNPVSPNKELAIRYLEYRLANMNVRTAYKLDSTLNEPVRHEGFEESVKTVEESLALMQKMMDEAEDVDKADYQEGIYYYTKWLEDKDQHQWMISQKAIDRYREIAPYAYIPSESLFLTSDGKTTASEELNDMLARYAGGQLKLDAFLREMDQKVRMIVLEGR